MAWLAKLSTGQALPVGLSHLVRARTREGGELQSGARDAQLGAAFLLAPARRRAGEAGEGRGFPLFLQIGGKERGVLCCGVAREKEKKRQVRRWFGVGRRKKEERVCSIPEGGRGNRG
jgi:hypothetical protein